MDRELTEPPSDDSQADTPKHDDSTRPKDRRAEREAEALRENLRRRKQQARARAPKPDPPKPD